MPPHRWLEGHWYTVEGEGEMSKRDQLALILCREENGEDACKENCIHPENNSFCPYGFVVDKLLGELWEPGRGVDAALKNTVQELLVGWDENTEQVRSIYPKVWKAGITAIKAGK